MTLLPTIPRRPGFIAHQSGERLVEGAELELPLAAGAEALLYLQNKHGHKDSEGSDLPKTQEMPRSGLRLAQDSDNSNQGRDSVGSDLVEDERWGRRAKPPPRSLSSQINSVGKGY